MIENNETRQNMLSEYSKALLWTLKKKKPDLDEEVAKEKIKEYILKNLKLSNVEVSGEKMPIFSLSKMVNSEGLIVTGSGSIYQPQRIRQNNDALMLNDLSKDRSVAKKKKFENEKKGNLIARDKYDNEQKTIKILANSFYGAKIQKNSIFYDSHSGPAITYTGVEIVTTSAIAFEQFIGGRIFFMNIDEIYNYIYLICKEEYKEHDIEIYQIPSDRIILERLVDAVEEEYSNEDYNRLKKFFSTLSNEEKMKIHFKSNLHEFIDNSNIFENKLSKLLGKDDFLDPNEPPEYMIESLDEIFDILKDYVIYNYQDYNRMYRMHNKTRSVVLNIDTDSNFLYLDPLYEFLKNKKPEAFPFDEKAKEDKLEERVSNISVLNYFNTKLLKLVYAKFCKDLGVEDNSLGIIEMKNEFLISRQMTTDKKKTYASLIVQQEGVLFDKPKVDIKGLAIRKVDTNKKVRSIITDILEEDILKEKGYIDLIKIIKKFKHLEQDIKKSLEAGETVFLKPGKANVADAYVNPYSIMAFRGALTWNIMYPEKEIALPDKILLLKLNINTFDDIKEVINDEETLDKFRDVFKVPELIKNGMNVIAVQGDHIPEELRPFINYDEIINDHVKAGLAILEAVGIKIVGTKTRQVTNVVQF